METKISYNAYQILTVLSTVRWQTLAHTCTHKWPRHMKSMNVWTACTSTQTHALSLSHTHSLSFWQALTCDNHVHGFFLQLLWGLRICELLPTPDHKWRLQWPCEANEVCHVLAEVISGHCHCKFLACYKDQSLHDFKYWSWFKALLIENKAHISTAF